MLLGSTPASSMNPASSAKTSASCPGVMVWRAMSWTLGHLRVPFSSRLHCRSYGLGTSRISWLGASGPGTEGDQAGRGDRSRVGLHGPGLLETSHGLVHRGERATSSATPRALPTWRLTA